MHPREEAPVGVWSERASGLREKVFKRIAGLREYEGIIGLTEEASKRIMDLRSASEGSVCLAQNLSEELKLRWGRHLRRQSEGEGCLRCGVWYEKAPEEERDVGLTGKGHEGADRRM